MTSLAISTSPLLCFYSVVTPHASPKAAPASSYQQILIGLIIFTLARHCFLRYLLEPNGWEVCEYRKTFVAARRLLPSLSLSP